MNLNEKVLNATKWSVFTEVIAKLITPITNMILARILVPEAFGVLATVTMVISFADMFTDAGFQKYLVQYEFKNNEEKYKYANVAFWTNSFISLIFWAFICLYKDKIAILVGNPGLGNVIAISCVQLILTSFSSIQMSLYKRDFDFKTLFLVRTITIFVPVVITIPLAMLGFSYWSLVIGSIIVQLINAVIMTIKSKWKPSLYYSISILKEMVSFSMWSLIEAISIWFTSWIDSFIIGAYLNEYSLGLYKTSTSQVNSILSVVTASIIPVLFSTLSRLQDDEEQFKLTYYKMQKLVAYIVLPIGVIVFVYRDLVTLILLGSQWSEAADIIGIWSIISALVIVFSYFNSEVYRAKGKPKISFISQIIHLIFLVPTCIISLKYGFWTFVYSRSLIRLQGVLVGLIIMSFVMGFSIKNTIINNIKPIIGSAIIFMISIILEHFSNNIFGDIVSIIICIAIYIIFIIKYAQDDFDLVLNKLNIRYTLNKVSTRIDEA